MNKVAVVISNYNYGRYVNSAIESCLAQTHLCSVIVVDDASSDDSWDVIQSYVKDGVTAVRLKKNSGGNARGKNVGICLSDAEYITCLDSDDMLLPESLSQRLDAFSDDADFVHGWSISTPGNHLYSEFIQKGILNRPFRRPGKALRLMQEKFSPRWSFAIQASTVLSRRSQYDNFGLYDEEMRWSIDREMWWRWLFHASKTAVVDKYVSIYRRHSEQVTGDRRRKDPKKQQALLRHRREMRKQITKENTFFPENYDFMSYIDEVIS